jgi:hypothetical protein
MGEMFRFEEKWGTHVWEFLRVLDEIAAGVAA